jgi:hypothetical protein
MSLLMQMNTKTAHQRGFAPIVFLVLLAVILSLGGYLVWQIRIRDQVIGNLGKEVRNAYLEVADNAPLPSEKSIPTAEPCNVKVFPVETAKTKTIQGVTVKIGSFSKTISKDADKLELQVMVQLDKNSSYSVLDVSTENFSLFDMKGNLGLQIPSEHCPVFPAYDKKIYLYPGQVAYGYLNFSIPKVADKPQFQFAIKSDDPAKDRLIVFSDILGLIPALPPTGKPVIYLYPQKRTDITVKLLYAGQIQTTYPKYDSSISGWKVTAFPDGKIIDPRDNREYSYLFWDGYSDLDYFPITKGFVVEGSKSQQFLQDTLPKMGLVPKEYNEFITYWLPKLEKNPYNLIYFATNEYERMAKLDIIPKPDSILRIYMAYQPLTVPIKIPTQEIKPFERKGFTVVEWGGREVE